VPPLSAPLPEVAEPATLEPDVAGDPGADSASTPDAWLTLVWNDPVNLMNYVAYVFESYFGYSSERANALMLQVHNDGRAVVSRGGRERMEVDVQAMHDFGLWATIKRDEVA
jgi:ATP-dependent Clp protease adaptor protein ClpS